MLHLSFNSNIVMFQHLYLKSQSRLSLSLLFFFVICLYYFTTVHVLFMILYRSLFLGQWNWWWHKDMQLTLPLFIVSHSLTFLSLLIVDIAMVLGWHWYMIWTWYDMVDITWFSLVSKLNTLLLVAFVGLFYNINITVLVASHSETFKNAQTNKDNHIILLLGSLTTFICCIIYMYVTILSFFSHFSHALVFIVVSIFNLGSDHQLKTMQLLGLGSKQCRPSTVYRTITFCNASI